MRLNELLNSALPDGTRHTQETLGVEVAKRVRVRDDDYTQETVSRWKTGKHKPSIAAVEAIADIYGCTVDWLLGRSEYRNGAPPLPQGWCVVDDRTYEIVFRGGRLPEDEAWGMEIESSCRLVKGEEYSRMKKALKKR